MPLPLPIRANSTATGGDPGLLSPRLRYGAGRRCRATWFVLVSRAISIPFSSDNPRADRRRAYALPRGLADLG